MLSHRKGNFQDSYFSGVACICSPTGSPLGTGFIIDYEDLVVTCAHVLKNQNKGDIRVKFWGNTVAIPAIVENSAFNISKDKDIIVLKLLGDVPKDVRRLSFGPYTGNKNDLITLGFPFPDSTQGVFAQCEIVGVDTHSGFAIFQVRSPEITLGFSGAPIMDRMSEKVVAVVVSIVSTDRYGKLAETAFAISASDVYSELLRSLPTRSLSLGERRSVSETFQPFVKSEKEELIILPSDIGVDLPHSDLKMLISDVVPKSSSVAFKLLQTALISPRLISTLGLSRYINSNFTPEIIAVAEIDTVYLVDVKTLNVTDSIKVPSQPTLIALSEDGQFLAIAHINNSVSVWRIIDKSRIAELSFDGKIEHLFFSSTKPIIMSIGTWTSTNFFKVSDVIDVLSSISHVRLARIFLRGTIFAGLDTNEKSIFVWDLPTQKMITTIRIEYPVLGLEFADENSAMLLGVVNSELRWWNIRSGQIERKLELGSEVKNVTKARDSNKLIVTLMGGNALVIDLNNGKIVLSRDFLSEIKVLSVESNCSNALVSVSERIFLWDLLNDECTELPFSNSRMRSAFLIESLAILCRSNRVEFWDTRTFSRIFTMSAKNLLNISVSKGLTTLIGSPSADTLKIVDVTTSVNINLEFNDTRSIDFNDLGTMLVASNKMSEVAIWDLHTMSRIQSNSNCDIALLKFLGDANVLMINSDYTTLNILSTTLTEVLATLKLTKKVESVTSNMEGTFFGLLFTDGELCIYETLTCKKIFHLLGQTILGFFFCSQTECLVINLHSVRIVDSVSGKEIVVRHTRDKIFGVDFHNWSSTICINWGKSVSVYTLFGQLLAQIDFENTVRRVNLINNGRWLMVIDDQDILTVYPCEINELKEIALRFLSSGVN